MQIASKFVVMSVKMVNPPTVLQELKQDDAASITNDEAEPAPKRKAANPSRPSVDQAALVGAGVATYTKPKVCRSI